MRHRRAGRILGRNASHRLALFRNLTRALFEHGRLCPHLEIGQQPFRKGETYDQQLGDAARKRVGHRKWQKRLRRAIANLRTLTGFDHLYIGGGNARRLDLELPADVTIVDNGAGLAGGAALWRDAR